MHKTRPIVAVLVSLGLLALQLSGLHAHVDEHGFARGLSGTHVHGVHRHTEPHDAVELHRHVDEHDGDLHDGDRDVALVELSGNGAKLLAYLPVADFTLAFAGDPNASGRPDLRTTPPSKSRARWRPPLRAPPFRI